MYVKGIWVQNHNLLFGINLLQFKKLGQDRTEISESAVKLELESVSLFMSITYLYLTLSPLPILPL